MKQIVSRLIQATPALALSLAMVAASGTAEAGKRKAHDWVKNPAAYAPDELTDYGSLDQAVAKVNRKVKTSRKIKPLRSGGWDWNANPGDYAPDELTDYGTIAADEKSDGRSVSLTIESKPVTGRKDWFINPGHYAPDGLSDYADEMKA